MTEREAMTFVLDRLGKLQNRVDFSDHYLIVEAMVALYRQLKGADSIKQIAAEKPPGYHWMGDEINDDGVVLWQWLDTVTVKRIRPNDETASEWRPLYAAPSK